MAPAFRKVALAALFATSHSDETCARGGACEEETSLMQDLVKRGRQTKLAMSEVDLKAKHGRHDSISKLIQTAEHMIKNGATPDVLKFVTTTINNINDEVMPAIMDEHKQDQALLDKWLQTFTDELKEFENHDALVDPREQAAKVQSCRSEESAMCTKARVCQADLEKKWDAYVLAETAVRDASEHVKGYMCLREDATTNKIDAWNPRWECPNWPEIRKAPTGDYCPDGAECPDSCPEATCEVDAATGERTCSGVYDRMHTNPVVTEYREVLQGLFEHYMEKKHQLTEGGTWEAYSKQLEECQELDDALEEQTESCDKLQLLMEEETCAHDGKVRQRRKEFGKGLDEAGRLYRIAIHGHDDLDHYNKYTTTSDDGLFKLPFCPDFDEDAMKAEMSAHFEDREGSGAFVGNETSTAFRHSDDSAMTRENVEGGICRLEYDRKRETETLHIVMCLLTKVNHHVEMSIKTGEDCPTESSHPDLVKNEISECHQIADTDGAEVNINLSDEVTYTYNRGELDIKYGKQPVPPVPPRPADTPCTLDFVEFEQGTLPTCAAPRMCLKSSDAGKDNCAAMQPEASDSSYTDEAYACMLHQRDLFAGEQDADTFVCGDGTCIDIIGRCNGQKNCADNSDELNCDLTLRCNDDAGDYAVQAASGNQAEVVEKIDVGAALFFDRNAVEAGSENPGNHIQEGGNRYIAGIHSQEHRPSLNDNTGSRVTDIDSKLASLKWVKYSMNDKYTPGDHAMLKVTVPVPTKVYVNRVVQAEYEREDDDGLGNRPYKLENGQRIKITPSIKTAPWVSDGSWQLETGNTGVKFTSSYNVRGTSDEDTLGNGLRNRDFQDKMLVVPNGFSKQAKEDEATRHCAGSEDPDCLKKAAHRAFFEEFRGDMDTELPRRFVAVEEEFEGHVYSKVFPAGDIMLRGNDGKDGSYLVFLEPQECWAGTKSRWALPPKVEQPMD